MTPEATESCDECEAPVWGKVNNVGFCRDHMELVIGRIERLGLTIYPGKDEKMSHYYTRNLNPQCLGFGTSTGCRKPATVEVFNTYNASMGKFCSACAKAAIHSWQVLELKEERKKSDAEAD